MEIKGFNRNEISEQNKEILNSETERKIDPDFIRKKAKAKLED